jgi:imidazolonepropionase
VNAAHVIGRADRLGRLAPGYAADLVILDAPDWRYLAYHLGGADIGVVVRDGRVVWQRRERRTGAGGAPAVPPAA